MQPFAEEFFIRHKLETVKVTPFWSDMAIHYIVHLEDKKVEVFCTMEHNLLTWYEAGKGKTELAWELGNEIKSYFI